MAETMMKFTSVEKSMPVKRDPTERRADFGEIYNDFQPPALVRQSSRCEQCGIPYCQVHCPLANNIPDWLALAAEGRMEEAYQVSQSTNDLPEICGRICPRDRLCEGSCVLEQSRHGTVTIGAVEIAITENAWRQGWVKPPHPRRELEASVGIVGAGPAGLAAAAQLRRRGYDVDVYDRYDRAGGLLIYGIPNFKLEKDVVERRTRLLAEGRRRLPPELRSRPRRHPRRLARPSRRHSHCHRYLQGTGYRRSRRRSRQYLPRHDLPHRVEPQGPGATRWPPSTTAPSTPGARTWSSLAAATRPWIACVPPSPGRQVGQVPVPPRPRQHAGLDDRGHPCRGGRRRVHLAGPARGVPRQRRRRRAAGDAHPPRRPRCQRPPDAAAHRGVRVRHGGRHGAQGARLRARGRARGCSARRSWRSASGERSPPIPRP